MDTDGLPDPSALSLDKGDFESQIENILQHIRLTRQQVENLTHLFRDLEELLQYPWPGCYLKPFGSIITGLGIKSSDVDCYIQLPEYNSPDGAVIKARNILRSYPHLFSNLFAITKARVPILKTFHRPTGYNCDINFTSFSGVQNSKLIAHLLHMDPRAIKIAVILKYWSKVFKITGTNLMPNYALTMLVIFYLQQQSVLPSVQALQKNVDCNMVDNWNTAIDSNYTHTTSNTESLYRLLGGFFTFYADFNFDELVVCPYLGYPIQKKCFDLFINNFTTYQNNLGNRLCKPLRLESQICLQDPFEHSRNCTIGVYPKLATKIINLMKSASESYICVDKNLFLCDLLEDSENNIEELADKQENTKMRFTHNKVQKKRLHPNLNKNQQNYKKFNKYQNNFNRGKFSQRGRR